MSQKSIFSDPICGEEGIAKEYCGLMKNNSKSKGFTILHWVILGVGVIIGDILKWFPQIQDLFPDLFTYNVVNAIVDILFIISFFFILGLPGLLSLLKLFDSLVIFWLVAYIPELLPIAFWIEIFPAFSISILIYYLIKPLQ